MRLIPQKGAVMVETAIILPVFLMILYGIFQFALLTHQYLILNNAGIIGANTFSAARGSQTPYCDAVGSGGSTSCAICTSNCVNQILPAIAIFSAGMINTNNVTVTIKVGPVGSSGVACATDASCQLLLQPTGTYNAPLNTVAAVTIQYSIKPAIYIPAFNLSAFNCGATGTIIRSTTCSYTSPTAYALVQ